MHTKLAMTACITAMLVSGCIPRNTIIGSGMASTETRSVSNTVDDVRLNLSGTLRISFGPTASLSITADDNILPVIQSSLVDNTLIIDNAIGNVFTANTPIQYNLTLTSLDELRINGAADAVIGGLDETSFTIVINGAGYVTACGTAVEYTLDINGAGEVNALTLNANIANVNILGSGSAKTSVSDEINLTINGAGTLEHTGMPAINQTINGSGSVRMVDPPAGGSDPCSAS